MSFVGDDTSNWRRLIPGGIITMAGTVLIAGASGLVGAAAVDKFLNEGWNVIAASRRKPEVDSTRPFSHIALDLQDPAACKEAAKGFADVTHVIYTAVFELPGLVQIGRAHV